MLYDFTAETNRLAADLGLWLWALSNLKGGKICEHCQNSDTKCNILWEEQTFKMNLIIFVQPNKKGMFSH